MNFENELKFCSETTSSCEITIKRVKSYSSYSLSNQNLKLENNLKVTIPTLDLNKLNLSSSKKTNLMKKVSSFDLQK